MFPCGECKIEFIFNPICHLKLHDFTRMFLRQNDKKFRFSNFKVLLHQIEIRKVSFGTSSDEIEADKMGQVASNYEKKEDRELLKFQLKCFENPLGNPLTFRDGKKVLFWSTQRIAARKIPVKVSLKCFRVGSFPITRLGKEMVEVLQESTLEFPSFDFGGKVSLYLMKNSCQGIFAIDSHLSKQFFASLTERGKRTSIKSVDVYEEKFAVNCKY